ncbi:hypothetical protein [Pseudonocardia sp. H11422]|uniref:hypothetical protein n=1 Tax=Pseudonocardia sp. H11422 TaxID=2835866 RepID=UPI001BDC556D|nr:hypothetical protein [Pseudonocardia sp. H11422]
MHHAVSAGRLVLRDGAPVPDPRPKLEALQVLLRVAERRSKLLGLDAPTRGRVEVITESSVDAAIRQLEAELAERGAAA